MRFGPRCTLPAPRPHLTPLLLEVLEDRLPPGDLGLFGSLFLADWAVDQPVTESRRADQPTRRPTGDHGASTAGQWDLLTTLGALPVADTLALTAPSPTAPAGMADGDPGNPLFQVPVSFGFEDDPGLTSGPAIGVGPNTRANSRQACRANPQNGRTQSEVSMAYEPNSGAMVVGYNDARGFHCPTQDSGYQVTGWAYSLDGGFTFQDGGPLPGGQAVRGDPWLGVGPDGTIFMASLWNPLSAMSLHRGTVTEKGISWSNPTIISPDGGYDKEAMAIDPVSGNIYISYTRFGGPNGLWSVRSTDGGQTFERGVPIRPGNQPQLQGSFPVVGTAGEVFVAYNIGYPNNTGVGFAASYDEGRSYIDFGQVGTINNFLIPGHNRGLHTDFPQLAIDNSGSPYFGTLYLVWATQQAGTLGDVVLIRSTDGGATWSPPVKVNDDQTNGIQFFPTLSVDSNGYVNVAFYDRRENPGGTNTNLYFAQSRDGGASFLPNVKITDVPSNWNCCSDLFPNYGDYISSISIGPYTGVTWADGRDGDPDAYMAWIYPIE